MNLEALIIKVREMRKSYYKELIAVRKEKDEDFMNKLYNLQMLEGVIYGLDQVIELVKGNEK